MEMHFELSLENQLSSSVMSNERTATERQRRDLEVSVASKYWEDRYMRRFGAARHQSGL